MFPKCNHAELPLNWKRRGNPIAFIQFSNPADAKAAFDASQNLDIKGHKLTVLYAKITDTKECTIFEKTFFAWTSAKYVTVFCRVDLSRGQKLTKS